MIIFLIPKSSNSASVVALPRVMARFVPEKTLFWSLFSSQSKIWICSNFSKFFRILVLSFPRIIIHSTSIFWQFLIISSKIDFAPWLPQKTRICGFPVFQAIFGLGFFSKISLSRICPTTSHFFLSKNNFVVSNPRKIFSENCAILRFERPGIVSDSWIKTFILRLLAAIPIASAPGHHFEKTAIFWYFFCRFFRICHASKMLFNKANGYQAVFMDFVVESFRTEIPLKSIFAFLASFSSSLFFPPIQRYFFSEKFFKSSLWSEIIGEICPPVPPPTKIILSNSSSVSMIFCIIF